MTARAQVLRSPKTRSVQLGTFETRISSSPKDYDPPPAWYRICQGFSTAWGTGWDEQTLKTATGKLVTQCLTTIRWQRGSLLSYHHITVAALHPWVQWNIERGYQLPGIIEELKHIDADIISLQEVDVGCERSGSVDTGGPAAGSCTIVNSRKSSALPYWASQRKEDALPYLP